MRHVRHLERHEQRAEEALVRGPEEAHVHLLAVAVLADGHGAFLGRGVEHAEQLRGEGQGKRRCCQCKPTCLTDSH
jgi:hypothetical protein